MGPETEKKSLKSSRFTVLVKKCGFTAFLSFVSFVENGSLYRTGFAVLLNTGFIINGAVRHR